MPERSGDHDHRFGEAPVRAPLAANGAREVIAYVDDASPGDTERDRTAANRLYDQAGFTELDRLHSFLRRP